MLSVMRSKLGRRVSITEGTIVVTVQVPRDSSRLVVVSLHLCISSLPCDWGNFLVSELLAEHIGLVALVSKQGVQFLLRYRNCEQCLCLGIIFRQFRSWGAQ